MKSRKSLKYYCNLIPGSFQTMCVTTAGKEPGNKTRDIIAVFAFTSSTLNSHIPLPTPPPLSFHPSPTPQCQYELLPPSLARFSPTDPNIIIYTGYGLERCVQFYSLSQKTVVRTSALTHWATCMDVSPQGHLLAFGCQGE